MMGLCFSQRDTGRELESSQESGAVILPKPIALNLSLNMSNGDDRVVGEDQMG